MSVKVTELTKNYRSQKAVDAISFEAKKGEVLGFLGPNGAGKSTTMKMATGYIPPTSGSIQICGFDAVKNSKETSKRIGYLPENNPLYLEMYIKEYLQFCGGLHGLKGKAIKERVAEIIQDCGLEKEQHKKIIQLSKGYRQRVGLAQALLHNPEVLILDEPTTGLDPNQLVEIRQLIKSLARDKTVILSTHIMQEVKAICDRVVIINEGKIVANDTLEKLLSNKVVLRVEFAEKVNLKLLQSIGEAKNLDAHVYEISVSGAKDLRPKVFNLAKANDWTILSMSQEEQDLEEIFHHSLRPMGSMWVIYRKEVRQLLSSLIAYIVIGVFLTMFGLMLWVFPETSLLNYGFADLETLFALGPYVLMFLVPAITMRMIAEEKSSGTIELILTKPVSTFGFVFGKYLAAVTLIKMAILLTAVYVYSIYQLGNPVGNLDVSGLLGSYAGFMLLGAVFAAVGLTASTLANNQIVSFILAVFFCFFLYDGVSAIADLFSGDLGLYIEDLSLAYHYDALSRGLIDTRNLVFFLSTVLSFLLIGFWRLIARKLSYKPIRGKLMKTFVLGVAVILLINLISANYHARIDLTEDQRFTLKPATKELLEKIDQPLTVEIMIAGDLPAGFERLKRSIERTVKEFDNYTPGDVTYFYTDPSDAASAQERNENITYLMQQGFEPTQVYDTENGRQIQKTVFPYVILRYNQRAAGVLMLKGASGAGPQERLNQSIEGIEFELAVGLQRLADLERKTIGYVTGHNELDSADIAGFAGEMQQYFDLRRVDLKDSQALNESDALVIAQPKSAFSITDKYALDQYIMEGGRVIFLIDRLYVNMGMAGGNGTVAMPYEHELDDMLFRYGIRLNQNYIQDIQNFGRYPVVLDQAEDVINLPWPFYSAINDFNKHPITKNLDAVYARFFSTMDTVKADGVKKTPLMFTSPYTRVLNTPARVAFEEYANQPDVALFNSGKKVAGYLLEGSFTSLFKNRVLPEGIDQNDFREESQESKIIVVSDGDFVRNEKNLRTGAPFELGYNPYAEQGEKQKYANKDFMFNALAYLVDEDGLITSRNKEITLRPLNRVKLQSERTKWQVINLVLPIVLLVLVAFIRTAKRKRQFA